MPDDLSPEERRLLDKYLKFYEALVSGRHAPTTAKQAHFIAVFKNGARPLTPHEHAYRKYLRALQPDPPPPKDDRRHGSDDAPDWCSREGVKRMRAGLYGDMMRRTRGD